MAEFNKYEAEKLLRDLKSWLDEAVKYKEENDRLKKDIEDQKKEYERKIADLTRQQK